jgi:hypothetical protein
VLEAAPKNGIGRFFFELLAQSFTGDYAPIAMMGYKRFRRLVG